MTDSDQPKKEAVPAKDSSPSGKQQQPEADAAEVLNKMPVAAREFLGVATRMWGPPPNPFIDKLGPEHVTQVLGYMEDESKRQDRERRSTRRYTFFGYYLIAIGFVIFLVTRHENELIAKIGLALASFLGGFGIGKSRK